MWRWPNLQGWLRELRSAGHRLPPRTPLRLTWYARMQRVEDEDIAVLQRVASAGEALERLRQSPEWAAWLEVKEESQALATEAARAMTATDAQRAKAAAEYWAVEGLFSTMYRTITNGQKARKALAEVQPE